MRSIHLALSAGLVLSLAAAAPQGAFAAATATAAPTTAAKPAPTASVEKARAKQAANVHESDVVTPGAANALKLMSAYLQTLNEFEVKASTALELVLDSGQKVELDGVNTYKVHKPDGFMLETARDERVRQYFYNGKQLTINAPKIGFYATVDAPPTIQQTLEVAKDKYGIQLPLDDLFRWNDPATARFSSLKSGFFVGTATLNGVETDQFAFREENIDWQIWIAQGDKPLPLKVVIIDRSDPSHPAYSAQLDWNTAPQLAADTFTFTPGPDAKAIHIAASGK